jgi:hypothetical protein
VADPVSTSVLRSSWAGGWRFHNDDSGRVGGSTMMIVDRNQRSTVPLRWLGR